MKEKGIETKRVRIFVAFAFGIAWTIDLVIYVTGGLSSHQMGSLAWFLLVASMAAPSLANILTRLVTREGWRDLYLRHRLKQGWRFWALAWLGTPLLILLRDRTCRSAVVFSPGGIQLVHADGHVHRAAIRPSDRGVWRGLCVRLDRGRAASPSTRTSGYWAAEQY